MLRRQMLLGSLGAAWVAAAPTRAQTAADGPVVATAQGRLRGRTADGISAFLGVRYAAPPVGPDRLQPPRPAPAWDGVRDARAFGPKPPQLPYPPMVAELLPELAGPGEDCLSLNVWTPEPGAARLPVMVWIPGGMFEYHGTGACPWYDGTAFARDGVVCVTINYRVGAEGFLFLGDGLANLGLLDQIAALEWVRDNIAAFGGDSGNVTVFGESAGALSIATLLAMPRAEGLFRRAILQSGGGQHATGADTAARIGRHLSETMGVPPDRARIAAQPLDRLLSAQGALRAEVEAGPDPALWGEVALTGLPWQPVIDGDTLPALPLDRVRAGAGSGVDLMVGSNTQETRLFLVAAGAMDKTTPQAVQAQAAAYGLPPDTGLAAYRDLHPWASAGEMLSALQTDWYWRIPVLNLAEAHAEFFGATGGTWMYEFDWRSPRFGAGHSIEIPFVFDTLGRRTRATHGLTPPPELARVMHRAWVDFATSGNPGWPRYDIARRATLRFDTVSRLVEDPLAGPRSIWHRLR